MYMKSKIMGIENHGNKTHIRIKVEETTQRNYNRFRQDLIENEEADAKGFGGFSEIKGRDIDVNVFKGPTYLHLVFYADKKTKKRVLSYLFRYFQITGFRGKL